MMDIVVTTRAVRFAKLQSSRHDQQTNTQVITDWTPFLSPNQQCQNTEGITAIAGCALSNARSKQGHLFLFVLMTIFQVDVG